MRFDSGRRRTLAGLAALAASPLGRAAEALVLPGPPPGPRSAPSRSLVAVARRQGMRLPGDALDATGRVETGGSDGAHLVVDAPAGIVRAGDLGAPDASPDGDGGILIGAAAGSPFDRESAPPSPPAVPRAAGLTGFPDPTIAGVGWLVLASIASVAMTLLRRRQLQRRLASRVLERLAALAAPPERVR